MKSPRITVIGSSNTDLVITAARLPQPGETLLGGEFCRFHGGKGANQAVAAARAGGRVSFIGAHGEDDFGRAAKAALRAEGIDVSAFRAKSGKSSGIALIVLGGRERQNQIVVARSANDAISPTDVDLARNKITRAGIVVAQLEIPLESVTRAAAIAAKAGVPFLLNPAPARRLPSTLLRLVHTLVPNEHEAGLLTGESSPEKAAQALLRRGCRQIVVTLGARGALCVTAKGSKLVRAPRVKPVDTVGAGDCFTGWLAVGLAEGLSLEEAVRRSVSASALKVTRHGAQSGLPYRSEVKMQ
ncbi:MAG: ribokinase [Methylacidiphilales bacterium]|nr:ribokinase [Candidatus Methylacidiphilales bacterium]